ncbi:MAG: dockerin type I domain-containing protein [Limisphaerales bacterium]
MLQGDLTGDHVVNELDLLKLWKELKKPVAQRNLAFDLNGDGQVSTADLDFLESKYLTGSPVAQPATGLQSLPAGGSAAAIRFLSITPWWQKSAELSTPAQGLSVFAEEGWDPLWSGLRVRNPLSVF